MVREPETCPHREAGANGAAACRLLLELTGLEDSEVGQVGRDACGACCRHPLPTPRRINPVIASLLSKVTSGLIASGGRPGCDVGKAAELGRWAERQLQEWPSIHGRTGDRAGPSAGPWPSVAVVILCRRPGAALVEAIESVLFQSVPVSGVIVVDETGDQAVARVVQRQREAGVRLVRGAGGGVLRALRAGFEAADAEILCFLDADDILGAGYLERGLPLFARPEVGIVYSDVEHLGERTGRTFAPGFDPWALERYPYIHPASLVRRRALQIADAFRDGRVTEAHAHWVVWRRVVASGWLGARQPSVHRTRADPRPGPKGSESSVADYHERASLAAADVTIFTPLSFRTRLWDSYAAWLGEQTWPRDQCRLVLLDTSGVASFGRMVRQFVASCDYPDVRYRAEVVAEPGLADQPRGERLGDVHLACARIYNRMAREVATPYVLVVEDDIVPPLGVIDRLLRAFDPGTAAVSAPYRSRFHDDTIVWNEWGANLSGGGGVQPVEGTGFGCILLRAEVLARATFHYGDGEPHDFDRAFSRRLRQAWWTIKVDWSQECRHLRDTLAEGPAVVNGGEPE